MNEPREQPLVPRVPASRGTLVGRADLMRVWVGEKATSQTAETSVEDCLGWLGLDFERVAPTDLESESRTEPHESSEQVPLTPPLGSEPVLPPAEVPVWSQDAAVTPFWRAVEHTLYEVPTETPPPQVQPQRGWSSAPTQGAPFQPLLTWGQVVPRLRALLGERFPTGPMDLPQAVEGVARGRVAETLPRRPRRQWGVTLQIWFDVSNRLIPYYDDFEMVRAELSRRLGEQQIEFFSGHDPEEVVWNYEDPANPQSGYREPTPGTQVLILGDLGLLDRAGGQLRQQWRAFGRRLRERGCRPLALVPCAGSRVDGATKRVFEVATLAASRVRDAGVRRPAAIRTLLSLVSFAVRVEPGLLRACRRLLPELADPGLEADVWQEPVWTSRYTDAGTLGPIESVEPLIDEFEQQPLELRRRVLEQFRAWRGEVGCEILFEELSRLSAETRALLPESDRKELQANWEWLASEVERRDPKERSGLMNYAFRLSQRVSRQALLNPQVNGPITRIQSRFRDDGKPPPAASPVNEEIWIAQSGDELVLERRAVGQPLAAWPRDSWLATLRTRGATIAMQGAKGEAWQTVTLADRTVTRHPLTTGTRLALRTDCEGVLLESLPRSPSATAAGRDRFGLWEETEIVGQQDQRVTIRWRWIPPGTFWMGSPEDEPGRNPDEGPRHLVTISTGFWMADTPCTQEVWTAVIGKNPSRFQGDQQQPVEQVSWNEVEAFCNRVNAGFDHQRIQLPTEAQWEYACRAGSQSALYAIPRRLQFFIIVETTFPKLERLAWFSGNARGQTHPVRQKLPNAWGLYDMLGNVWEWCLDPSRQYDPQAVVDPGESSSRGESRVMRGGSWSSGAFYVRCPRRLQRPVGFQDSNLCFRLVRVQRS